MISSHRKLLLGTCLQIGGAIIAMMISAQSALANGWEHTSVPLSALVSALGNQSPDIREQAAFSMGYRHHLEASGHLIGRLNQGEAAPRVRQTIYQSLGKLEARDALDLLAACLKTESIAYVRASCANALGDIGGARAERLCIAGLGDDSEAVRLEVVRSLGSFSSDQVNQALVFLLQSDKPAIKLSVIEAMGKSGHPEATQQLLNYLALDSDEQQLIVVLQAIARLAGASALPALEKLYQETQSDRVRRYALLALSSVEAHDIIDYALQAVASEDFAARLSGLSILRETKSYGALPGLVDSGLKHAQRLYARPLEWFESHARQALLDLSLLVEYLRTVTAIDPLDGFALYEAASVRPDLPLNSPLLVKISEGFYQARWQATYAIAYAQNADAKRLLKVAAVDRDSRIRAVALRSIGVLGAHDFYDEISQALADDSAEVRWVAARVVGRAPKHKSELDFDARLITLLQDVHNTVRKEAAFSLGYLGVKPALESLRAVAKNDTNTAVREAAEYSVSLIEAQ